MPSSHGRIGVLRDPALQAALRSAEEHLTPGERRSEASAVRALALRGAHAVTSGASRRAAERARDLAPLIARTPVSDWEGFVLPEPEGDDHYPGTRALEWVRGER